MPTVHVSQRCLAGLPCLPLYVCRTEPLAEGEQPQQPGPGECEAVQAVVAEQPGTLAEGPGQPQGAAGVRVNPQAESGSLDDAEADSWSPLATGKYCLLTAPQTELSR